MYPQGILPRLREWDILEEITLLPMSSSIERTDRVPDDAPVTPTLTVSRSIPAEIRGLMGTSAAGALGVLDGSFRAPERPVGLTSERIPEIFIDLSVLPQGSHVEKNLRSGEFMALNIDLGESGVSPLVRTNLEDRFATCFSINSGRFLRIANPGLLKEAAPISVIATMENVSHPEDSLSVSFDIGNPPFSVSNFSKYAAAIQEKNPSESA